VRAFLLRSFARWPAAVLLTLAVLPAAARNEPQTPLPSPILQREEVRFVTLDVTIEEKHQGAWRRTPGISQEQMTVRLAGAEVELELFENHCTGTAPGTATAPATTGAEATSTGEAAPDSEPVRYVVYLDLTRLSLEGLQTSFKSLLHWADNTVRPEDEVMIVVAHWGLRIVRPFLPASQHLPDDLRAAVGMSRKSEFWIERLASRLKEAKNDLKFSGSLAGGSRLGLAAEEYIHQQRSMKNLRDAMSLFDGVDGTKNLVFFQETFNLYGGHDSILRQIPAAANSRNVRIYGVSACGLGKECPLVSSAITYLASETGGRWLERTNQLDLALEQAAKDSECFYRVGFRMRPRYDGGNRTIHMEVNGDRRYRLRYGRSVEDPTLEQMDTDMLLAAFLVPSSATAFPLSVEVVPLFDHSDGTRERIQVKVPLQGLLSLPVLQGENELSRIHVQVGGSVVALREPDGPEPGAQEISSANVKEVDPLEFSRQVMVTFSPDGADGAYLALAEELDAPPGRYRIVLVVQDRLAREVAAAVTEFQVAVTGQALGEVRLLVEDPQAVSVEAEDRRPARHHRPDRLAHAAPSLPDGVEVRNAVTLDPSRPGSLIYGMCDARSPAGDGDEAQKPFRGWKLDRSLECEGEGEPISLEGGRLPAVGWEEQCILVMNPIPAGSLPSGWCNFEVTLERPGVATEVQSIALEVAAASAGAAGKQP